MADVETTGEQEIIIPNDNLDIEPGNTFVLTGIKLPGARIGEAEQELLEAGTTWAQKKQQGHERIRLPYQSRILSTER